MASGRGKLLTGALLLAALLAPAAARADPVAVKHWEGLAHGFIGVRTLDGEPIADGDLVELTVRTARGNRVTTRLTLHFHDGSIHEETASYLQARTFHFLRDHLVQKGPAFKTQLDSTIDASGRVLVRYSEGDGKEKRLSDHVDLPPDVANGMLLAILKNVSPRAKKTTVSMVAITPKPRVVQLEFTPAGEDPFTTGRTERKATHYVMKVHVPGLAGAVASVLGKIPADSHFWVLTGEAPTFVKAELALFPGGPTWRLEQLSPAFREDRRGAAKEEPAPAPHGGGSSPASKPVD